MGALAIKMPPLNLSICRYLHRGELHVAHDTQLDSGDHSDSIYDPRLLFFYIMMLFDTRTACCILMVLCRDFGAIGIKSHRVGRFISVDVFNPPNTTQIRLFRA